ncbi:MAG: class II fructose-bisphosphate aldolase [Pseudomonadota bacterium]|nr:class II fructose-bisphosphate aldolase [Pseudomonadota bacterium]MEC8461193.1 class II fructose-bisphosphate aldolase [Pseudomonadota bacterium]
MAIITLRQLLDYAAEQNFGIPAFNINNLEQVMAIMRAAHAESSPVILQVSAGGRAYMGEQMLKSLINAATEQWPHIPICLHQDHGASPAVCASSIACGFSSVMMDGSLKEDMKTPSSYDYNVEVTKKVVDFAHAQGVSVEGELGCLGSLESGLAADEDGSGAEGVLTKSQLLTCPHEAKKFVSETQVDALAIAIGTSHGAYKFSKKPTSKVLDIDRVRAIHQQIPNTHLVMHGSSSVPQNLIEQINRYGGSLKPAFGVPIEEIQKAIPNGVRKINIDTDLRLAFTAAVRQHFSEMPQHFDPRQYLKPAIQAMFEVCQLRYQAFGSSGHASRIKPLSKSLMVDFYNDHKKVNHVS